MSNKEPIMITLAELEARVKELEVTAAADVSVGSVWAGAHLAISLALAFGFGFLLAQFIRL